MSITTLSELKTAISEWSDRTDLTDAKLSDFVMLAEANFNRELDMVETDVTLTGTIGSRAIDISSYDIVEPIALWMVDADQEYEIEPRPDGSFAYYTENGEPTVYGLDGDYINFDCPLDTAYSFRFRYKGKFALSSIVTTNKLLQDHPDIYLAGAIVWGGLFTQDDQRTQTFASALNSFMASAKHTIAKNKRGTLTIDPGMIVNSSQMGAWRW